MASATLTTTELQFTTVGTIVLQAKPVVDTSVDKFKFQTGAGALVPIMVAAGVQATDAVNFTQLTATNDALAATNAAVAAVSTGITWDVPVDAMVTSTAAANAFAANPLAVGKRIAYNEPSSINNGVWTIVTTVTPAFPSDGFTRATGWLLNALISTVSGKAFVDKATDTAWVESIDTGTIGTDPMAFVQISQQAITAGTNIALGPDRIVNLASQINLSSISSTSAITASNSNVGGNAITASNSAASGIAISITDGDLSLAAGSNIILSSSGNVTAGSFTTISDERKKDIVGGVFDAAETVNRIAPIYYTYKADTAKQMHCGVSAQQTRDVIPDAVYEDKDGFLSVDYHYFTGILLAYCKEMGQELAVLREEVSALKRVHH